MPGQLVEVMVEVQLAEIFVPAGSRGVLALGTTNSFSNLPRPEEPKRLRLGISTSCHAI
jgi:hypothetical protein